MSITYNQILEEMEQAYYDECGEYVKNMSDLEQRFKAVASEIYAVSVNADFVLKQAFPQTATGEYLDRHAAMRSITRKTPEYAKGTLTFSINEVLETDVTVPERTVCSKEDSPLIQFATDEKAIIKAGELSVSVAATALLKGEEYNAKAGEITVMVNPPEYVMAVTNENDFTGGADEETDESLRQRIISSYNVMSNGINEKSLAEILLTLEDIVDANITFDPDEKVLNVCVRTKDGEIQPMTKIYIQDLLACVRMCSVPITYTVAQPVEFSVFAAIKTVKGTDKETLEQEIVKKIKEVCSARKIGAEISTSRIMTALYGMDEIELIEISATPSSAGMIACGSNEYLVLKDVQVDFYE